MKVSVGVEQLFDEVAELYDLMIAEEWWELDAFPWEQRRLESKCENWHRCCEIDVVFRKEMRVPSRMISQGWLEMRVA